LNDHFNHLNLFHTERIKTKPKTVKISVNKIPLFRGTRVCAGTISVMLAKLSLFFEKERKENNKDSPVNCG
jgi:hypothetical protein